MALERVQHVFRFAALTCCLTATAWAAEWAVVAQPDLKQVIDNAAYLEVENLGRAAVGVDPPTSSGMNLVANPDGKSYDVLLWYREAYARHTRVYVVDLGAGTVTRQAFPELDGRVRVEQGFTWWGVQAPNGKLYGCQADTNTNAVNAYQYDPATNLVTEFATIPNCGGERIPTALSPDGWIYGSATYIGEGEDNGHRVVAYGFNPNTGEVRNYGPVGPRIDGTAYGYTAGCDDTHIYIAAGQIPWYLLAVNIETGETTVLATAPEGGANLRMEVRRHYGGATAFVQQADDAPRRDYWLHHGQAIPKVNDNPPWKKLNSPVPSAGPEPQTHLGDLYPDPEGNATFWWRPGGEEEWRAVRLTGVEKHPLSIHRLIALPDGRIWGTTSGYKGRFLFDPKTARVTDLGDGGGSIYALAVRGDRLYWSGYPSAPVFAFDWTRPWTVNKGGPPGYRMIPETAAESNPRRVHEDYQALFLKTRVKKMLSAAVGGDGKVYFGGIGQRDYIGGGLSWYDPDTGELGGLWQPFAGRGIGWIAPAVDGRYIVAATRSDKVFFFDTQAGAVVGEAVPVPGVEKTGPLYEVAPGRLLALTDDPEVNGGGLLYGIEAPSGDVLFRKPVPYALQFTWTQGTDQTDYQRGPDGCIWTYLGNALVRIHPDDARVDVIGKMYEVGQMAFSGDDLYLTGTTEMRCLRGVVARAAALAKRNLELAATPPLVVDPNAPKVAIPFEAEAGECVAPMLPAETAEASGGQYVASPAAMEGRVTFTFSVPAADDYVVWARVFGPTMAEDSFFVIADSGVQDIFDTGEGAPGEWHWTMVNGRGSGGPLTLNPRVFRLGAGEHRLIFRGREPNARLDRIIITNDRDFRPEE